MLIGSTLNKTSIFSRRLHEVNIKTLPLSKWWNENQSKFSFILQKLHVIVKMTLRDYKFYHNSLFLIFFIIQYLHNSILTISVPQKTSVLIKLMYFLNKHESKSTCIQSHCFKYFCGNILTKNRDVFVWLKTF